VNPRPVLGPHQADGGQGGVQAAQDLQLAVEDVQHGADVGQLGAEVVDGGLVAVGPALVQRELVQRAVLGLGDLAGVDRALQPQGRAGGVGGSGEQGQEQGAQSCEVQDIEPLVGVQV